MKPDRFDLTIRVSRAPVLDAFEQWSEPTLAIQRSEEHLQEQTPTGGELVFHAWISPRGTGPFVFGKPGERFLYLVWLGTNDGRRERFRRIKVMLPTTIDESMEVTIAGAGSKGDPACARAAVTAPWKPATSSPDKKT